LVAAAAGGLVGLAGIGWLLWRTAPDPLQAKADLGTGLLIGVVVATVVGGAQIGIDERRRDAERRQQAATQRAAEQQSLRLTVGLREELAGIDLSGQDLSGFYLEVVP
jgi:hypothetical protein